MQMATIKKTTECQTQEGGGKKTGLNLAQLDPQFAPGKRNGARNSNEITKILVHAYETIERNVIS